VDAAGRVGTTGRLFDGSAPTLVATTDAAPDDRVDAWIHSGAEVLVLPRDESGRVSLRAMVEALGKRDVQGVLVEGGADLAWSLARDRLVDRVVIYVAPALVGGVTAPGAVGGVGFAPIDEAVRLDFTSVEWIGADLRLEADVHRDR
jgi:diaminohydroxyphosphoribosylaminopyrimidine deaminase/5-amino-6-(5-phosphoribosylamino)uracil reductase